MQIARSIATHKGPTDWFTGDVHVDPVVRRLATRRLSWLGHSRERCRVIL
jgi:hypothetical protein